MSRALLYAAVVLIPTAFTAALSPIPWTAIPITIAALLCIGLGKTE